MADWDVIFLGYHMQFADLEANKQMYRNDSLIIRFQPVNLNLMIGGLFAYIIHKRGAKKYLQYINDKGIKHSIDVLMIEHNDKRNLSLGIGVNLLEIVPHIVFSDWVEPGKPRAVDSDVQFDILPIRMRLKNDSA